MAQKSAQTAHRAQTLQRLVDKVEEEEVRGHLGHGRQSKVKCRVVKYTASCAVDGSPGDHLLPGHIKKNGQRITHMARRITNSRFLPRPGLLCPSLAAGGFPSFLGSAEKCE